MGAGGVCSEPLDGLHIPQFGFKKHVSVCVGLVDGVPFGPLRDGLCGEYSAVVNFRQIMIELVIVGNGDAVDGQLLLFLVELLGKRLQSLVIAAVPRPGVVSL